MSADSPSSFDAFFRAATGRGPYDYQMSLAERVPFPELLDVPTGLGKTAAVVLAWLWRRIGDPSKTPRRLVYCLPMRTLVEQTEEAACRWIANLRERHLLRDPCRVHVLMGGERAGPWDLHPECDAILVGTQDMLLSRLLNRGYGMSRYRWPMHFGLLGNDCLWIMDEVQLMGSGLATTVQIDLFQKCYWKPARPCYFLWMSATLGGSMLATRDRVDAGIGQLDESRCLRFDAAKEAEAVRERIAAAKTIEVRKAAPSIRTILDQHKPGRMSLVILNTVPTARGFYDDLLAALDAGGSERPAAVLLHSRFRPPDRERHMATLREFVDRQKETGKAAGHPGIVVVSTQVVEAGLDISSVRLWSEIAPWASVVQRLGRLNREGKQPGAVATFWMPKDDKDGENAKDAPNARRVGPYLSGDLKTAEQLLKEIIERLDAAGQGRDYRKALDEVLGTERSKEALNKEYESVIRPHDFLELFSTEPDLAGGFTDISRFVRDQDRNIDAHVFWRADEVPEPGEPAPSSAELCAVPYYSLQQFLKRTKGTAREWDAEAGEWAVRRPAEVRPGMTLRLWQKQGGYCDAVGWTADPKHRPTLMTPGVATSEGLAGDEASGGDAWLPLRDHTGDVVAETRDLVLAFGLSDGPEGRALLAASRWHDVGKASVRWKQAIDRYLVELGQKVERCRQEAGDGQVGRLLAEFAGTLTMPGDGPWAKFPEAKWAWTRPGLTDEQRRRLRRGLFTWFRPGYRHEAASAMVAWKAWREQTRPDLSGLAVYLIACHHGKVRTVLRSIRGDDALFGIRDGEQLPAFDGLLATATTIPTEPRRFGATGRWDDEAGTFTVESTSWVSLVEDLLGGMAVPRAECNPEAGGAVPEQTQALGPFKLAFLETLLRVADARASATPGKGRAT